MKTDEDKMISALFRERSIKDNKSDPGPDWQESDFSIDMIRFLVLGLIIYGFLAS